MNIRVDTNTPIYDGREVVFRSPADCSLVTGLIVYYPDNGVAVSREFAFADAHGENVGNIDALFGKDAVVKAILDLDTGMAFVQNADTNAYLEGRMGRITHPVTGNEFNDLALDNKLVPGDSYLITEDDDNDDLVTKGKIFRAKDKVNYSYLMSVGGGGSGSAEGAVLYTEQALTPEQQEQARMNINALPGETVWSTGNVASLEASAGVSIEVNGDTGGTVTLVHQGKNFLPSGLQNQPVKSESGITITANDDGSATIIGNGTTTVSYHLMHSAFGTEKAFPAGKYVMTVENTGTGQILFVVKKKDANGSLVTLPEFVVTPFVNNTGVKSVAFELDDTAVLRCYLTIVAGRETNMTTFAQIESGTEYTKYEPFNAAEHEVELPATVSAYNGTNVLYTTNGDNITAKVALSTKDIVRREAKEAMKVDPSVYPIPVLYLNGDTIGMDKDNDVTLNYEFQGRTGTLTCKWQGSSSLTFPKKNYTLKFDNAFEAVDGWGEQKKYCVKANYNDFTQSRNVVCAKLWGDMGFYRSNATLAACPNYGAVDGFPIAIVLNGDFHGIYCFNIPKDAWMMNMGNGTTECILCADITDSATNFKSEALLDGSDFEIEYITDEDNTAWAVASVNNLIRACINSDGTDLDTTIASMLDWESAIDYYIFSALTMHWDGITKNYLLSTYDGTKWFFGAYDMDSTFGNTWDGSTYYRPDVETTFAQIAAKNRIFELIRTYKKDALKERYNYLRNRAMREAAVAKRFMDYAGNIPLALQVEENRTWTSVPRTSVQTIDSILNWYRLRCQVIDAEIEAM